MNNVAVIILGMVYTVVSARLLGPDQRGILVIAVLVPNWVAPLSMLGLLPSLVYNLSQAEDTSHALGEAIGISFRFLIVSASLIGLSYTAMLHSPILRSMPTELVIASLFFCGSLVLESIVLNLLTGLQDFRWRNTVTATRPTLTAIALTCFWIAHVALTPLLLVQTMTCLALLAFLLGCVPLVRTYHPRFGLRVPENWMQSYVWYGLKFYIASVAQALNYRFDILIVNAQLGSRQVALYSVGVSAAELLLLIPVSATLAFYPKITASQDETRNTLTLLTLGMSLYVVVVGAVILELALPWLLPLAFGSAFIPAIAVAQWLIPGMAALTVVRVLSYASAGVGRPEYATYTMIVGVLGTVPLDLLLIPKYGIMGAVVASTISYSLSAAVIIFLYVRLRRISWTTASVAVLIEPLGWLTAKWRLQYSVAKAIPTGGTQE